MGRLTQLPLFRMEHARAARSLETCLRAAGYEAEGSRDGISPSATAYAPRRAGDADGAEHLLLVLSYWPGERVLEVLAPFGASRPLAAETVLRFNALAELPVSIVVDPEDMRVGWFRMTTLMEELDPGRMREALDRFVRFVAMGTERLGSVADRIAFGVEVLDAAVQRTLDA